MESTTGVGGQGSGAGIASAGYLKALRVGPGFDGDVANRARKLRCRAYDEQ
ncbi:hypothetical protein EMIHUDRAFT_219068 [Emiliania huxleyi CCMP1516]|uniref:Uncharacterized protein n=2 Tax=Emiliania huxleyi TaxID=2903 RepID=A0A0D3I5M8_EMIH1|nr:hypothetical protein EMIHUDRAFT_219068 [Emiliania huxleyi CCMP1516]EOD06563.1 hypothetical protein EMIHUDRAFT_219068 [Emiliania huxleyi CCMP1516]|eukprot:XP_005758992.1 hypothetical protein EMIHUDRAFT_219068 [Emiliania huxleyi CCMP1516]